MHHHLLHLALAEVERPEEEVAVRPLHRALGMVQRDGAGGLLLCGQHGEPGVDLDAEEPEHPPRQGARGARHRREGADDEADHRRDPGRDGLGPGHGQGPRQHLGEDEDGRRHHQRGESTPFAPKRPAKQAGGERDGEDVRKRGAEQERADQPLLVLGQAQRLGGALLAAVGHGVQPRPAGGGERGLGAGEERRDEEKRHDARQREDRGRLGQGVHAGPHSVADGRLRDSPAGSARTSPSSRSASGAAARARSSPR